MKNLFYWRKSYVLIRSSNKKNIYNLYSFTCFLTLEKTLKLYCFFSLIHRILLLELLTIS